MGQRVAMLMVTIPAFNTECKVVAGRFRDLGFTDNFDCYLAKRSDEEELDLPGWKKIELDNRVRKWGADMKEAIALVPAEYLLICFDDFYVVNCSNPRLIREAFEEAIESGCKIGRIRDNFNERYRLMPTERRGLYRSSYINKHDSSLVFTMIEKRLLETMLDDNDSPWKFEKQALDRFRLDPEEVMQSSRCMIRFVNLVVKGRLLRSSLRSLSKLERIYIRQNSRHSLMRLVNELIYQLKLGVHRICLRWLPHSRVA